MVSAPQYHRNKLKFIQLSRVDSRHILAVIVVEGNVIKNTMLTVAEELSDETLLKLNILLFLLFHHLIHIQAITLIGRNASRGSVGL